MSHETESESESGEECWVCGPGECNPFMHTAADRRTTMDVPIALEVRVVEFRATRFASRIRGPRPMAVRGG
jgi:hypothetical protein